MTLQSSTHAGVCASCRQPLVGRYCSQCGEKTLDPHDLTVRHFVTHTLVHEIGELDSKTWRTLRSLLFRPGFLTAEYCAGRRRLYISPAKILITAILLYVFLTQGGLLVSIQIGTVNLSIAPTRTPRGMSVAETVARINRLGVLKSLLAAKEKSKELSSEAAREKFHRTLETVAQPLSFANVLLLGLALHALFHRRRPLFLENGVFSMHLVSFILLSSLVTLPGIWIIESARSISLTIFLAVFFWQFSYMAVAIRRFYFGREPRWFRSGILATAAALLIYVLNSAFITSVQMFGGTLALWSI